jgi:prepilin-type N-terminal cleavage/methylation domain-containing protein
VPLPPGSGFTIIEVLIAVVVLATGIVVILQGLHTALNALDAAVDKTRAAALLDRKLGEVRVAALSSSEPTGDGSSGSFETPYRDYRWQLNSHTVPLQGGAAGGDDAGVLHEVDIVVWRHGRERRYSVSTLVYECPSSQGDRSGGSL